jgi:hypothetical protein
MIKMKNEKWRMKNDEPAKKRHPGEGRGPEVLMTAWKDWIPAFAGMTEKRPSSICETNEND